MNHSPYRRPVAIAASRRTIGDYVRLGGSAFLLVGLVWLCEVTCALFEKDANARWTIIAGSTLVCMAATLSVFSFLEKREDEDR